MPTSTNRFRSQVTRPSDDDDIAERARVWNGDLASLDKLLDEMCALLDDHAGDKDVHDLVLKTSVAILCTRHHLPTLHRSYFDLFLVLTGPEDDKKAQFSRVIAGIDKLRLVERHRGLDDCRLAQVQRVADRARLELAKLETEPCGAMVEESLNGHMRTIGEDEMRAASPTSSIDTNIHTAGSEKRQSRVSFDPEVEIARSLS